MNRKTLLVLCIIVTVFALIAVFRLPFNFEDIKIQQAAIAGTVVATGWLVTFIFREASELIERSQRGRDLQKAFRAEIEDYFVAFDDGDSDASIANLRSRFEQEDGTAIPVFFPLVSDPVIFEKLSDDIHILPEMVINDTIRFYSMLTDIRLFAEDLRSESFLKLSSKSQLLAFEDYIEMRETACLYAYDAMEKINSSLNETIQDPEAARDRIYYAERVCAIRG